MDGQVGLALGDGAGRTQVGMFVNKAGQPGITLFDDRETARFSLEIVEVPEEIELSREQLKTMPPQEIGQFYRQHRPQRPMMVFCDTHGNKRSAMSTDQVVLWGENAAQIASLSSVPPRGSAACGKLTLANQADSGKVHLGVMPLERPFIECHQQGEQTHSKDSWPHPAECPDAERSPGHGGRIPAMASRIQQTVAPGIYRLGSGGFRVKVAVGDRKRGGHQRETTFPPNTGLREMKAWQTHERARLLRQGIVPARGTLEADLPTYLAKMKRKLAHVDSREDEINAWPGRFGSRRRHTITRDEVRRQIKDWEDAGAAASTIRHRMTALSTLYAEVDGEDAYNPVKGVRSHLSTRTSCATPTPRCPLRRAGADIADIQELLGHKSPKTTQRYAMVVPEKLVAATLRVEKVWAHSRGQGERSTSQVASKRKPAGR
ncbi:MAG: hypothetical protein A3H29_08660 [Acidobacteria bacterium RIFCSPLOWO2_02_FULL_67_21]|nr:MAG: hypothetical protein A3H29_08660 [Acidobacteria bacterium RIFCSPLOWO2_02_FULL_67_21]